MIHLDDAELVRYVDHEHDPADAARWREHLESCDRCGRELDAVRAQSRLVSDWLERAAFEDDLPDTSGTAPARLRSAADSEAARRVPATATPAAAVTAPAPGAWLKAAVVILFLAAPLAAFPSLRVWVMDQVARTAGPPAVEETGGATSGAGAVVRFTPAAGTFTIRVEAADAGTLVLERATGDDAALRLTGGAEPVVSAGSLRILGGGPDAAHRLALPAAVTGAIVMVGPRVVTISDAQLDAGRTVELAGDADDDGPEDG